MTHSITVKNTFLTIDESASDRVPRSSSVPRTFKPGMYEESPHYDDSTNASDKDASDNVQATCSDSEFEDLYPDCRRECSGCLEDFVDVIHSRAETSNLPPLWADEDPEADDTSRVTLNLVNMVPTAAKARCKLRTQAKPFQSVMTPPAEVAALISSAVEVLSSGNDIINVQVNNGGMGGTTVIIGESSSTNPDVSFTFTLVKDALLNQSERSENSYILGYGAQPFTNLDSLSFSANIGCLPDAQYNSACWDTYEKGFCPRCSTCRWYHPSKFDSMRVIVMIKKQTSSTWLD